jgi:hypothetical protein
VSKKTFVWIMVALLGIFMIGFLCPPLDQPRRHHAQHFQSVNSAPVICFMLTTTNQVVQIIYGPRP